MPYDIAQICRSGHMMNDAFRELPESNRKHCPECGEPTITKCPECQGNIRGRYESSMALKKIPTPKFCDNCGSPFPWTEMALSAAKEYTDGLDSLSDEEKEVVKESIDDMVRGTPRRTVAVEKVKKLIAKAGGDAPAELKAILITVLTQATLHKLGW
jgi:hypothetical protein